MFEFGCVGQLEKRTPLKNTLPPSLFSSVVPLIHTLKNTGAPETLINGWIGSEGPSLNGLFVDIMCIVLVFLNHFEGKQTRRSLNNEMNLHKNSMLSQLHENNVFEKEILKITYAAFAM